MVKTYCDICGKDLSGPDDEDLVSTCRSYNDFLKEKGAGSIIVNVERIYMGNEDHYWTRTVDLCDACQERINVAFKDILSGG